MLINNITNNFDAESFDANKANILIVDDDRTMLMMLQSQLLEQNYNVITAKNGKEACSILAKEYNKISAILLDREMPIMDGIKVTKWIKKNPDLAFIPIIMQTGSGSVKQIKEGIDAGVYYYLTKPIDDDILTSVLGAAIREYKQQKKLQEQIFNEDIIKNLMISSDYIVNTIDDAKNLSCALAAYYPNSMQVLFGLAELLINAVEHGSLEISYDEKTKLLAEGNLSTEITKRQNLQKYKNREVNVSFGRDHDKIWVKIIDQGNGFDWKKFMHIEPSRVGDNHGRGIAQANMVSFDQIIYNDIGNEVTAIVRI